MAEIIWFNDNGLQTVERDWCETDEQRGLKAKIEPQEIPEGIEVQTRAPVVVVSLFDYNCPDPWVSRQQITMRQAKELGEWLCKRAAEYKITDERPTWRERFSSWLRPRQ
jgi:hypothetical protein